MKQLIKSALRRFGIDIRRYTPPLTSKRTRALSYFKTATGNYYLPRDAQADFVAAAVEADSSASTSHSSTLPSDLVDRARPSSTSARTSAR